MEVSSSKKILILDDDPDINLYLNAVLTKQGYEVKYCETPKDFFKTMMEFGPNLCIVDLNLGEYEGFGFEVVKLIRKKIGKEIYLLVMSRRSTNEDIEKALSCGGNDYIKKPIDDLTLFTKINAMFGNIHDERTALPYHDVNKLQGDCFIHFPIKIHSMTEGSLIFFSEHYIARNSYIEFTGPLAAYLNDGNLSMKCMVRNVNLARDLGGYLLSSEFDETDHEVHKKIRKLLLGINPLP